jgi:hypothetical protein
MDSLNEKSPVKTGLFAVQGGQLLDLAFLVHHMLANDGIVLFDLHLFRHVALVLGGGVEVTSASTGIQTNFLTHCLVSDLSAACC